MTDLKQYYRQIQRALPCNGNYKKRLIRELKESVDSYLKEHPDADIKAVETRFGSPEQIAAACSTEMDTSEIVNNYRLRKWIITIVAAAAAVALALWITALITASMDAADDAGGYIETGSVVIEEEEVYE